MGHRLPDNLIPLRDQPVEFVDEVGGLYFRAVLLVNAGDVIPQHVHEHEHVTLVANGRARVWVDDVFKGDYSAFQAILVEANRKHLFQALEPNTRLACVHQMSAAHYKAALGHGG